MTSTAIWAHEEMVSGQSSAEQIYNLQQLVTDRNSMRGSIKSRATTAQPGSPTNGDAYYLPTSGCTGTDWLGQDGKYAIYRNGWSFKVVREGMSWWVEDDDS